MSDREKELMAELLTKLQRGPEVTKLVAGGFAATGVLVAAMGVSFGVAYFAAGLFLLLAAAAIWWLILPEQLRQVSRAEGDLVAADLDVYELIVPTDLGPFTQPNKVVVARTVSGGVLNRYQLDDSRRVLPVLVPCAIGSRSAEGSRMPTVAEQWEMEQFWRVNPTSPLVARVILLFILWGGMMALYFLVPMGYAGKISTALVCSHLGHFFPGRLYALFLLRRSAAPDWVLRTEDRAGSRVEVIVGTNIPWTVDGRPAAWRRRMPEEFDGIHRFRKSWKEGERHEARVAVEG